MNPQSLNFFVSQLRVASVNKKSRRWSIDDKVLFISLHYQSPRAYKCLCSIFIMPQVRTIARWLENVNISSGFENDIFDNLKTRVSNMQEKDRVCSLLLDEVALKEGLYYNVKTDTIEGLEDFGNLGRTHSVANQGLVFMVRGIASNWKQPIGFFLSRNATSGETLTILVQECLRKLYSIGLKVKTVICDQGSGNQRMFSLLGITRDSPFIHMNGREKVYFLYDPPHLLKSIRNNLKSHIINVDGKDIKWHYIDSFYREDKKHGHTSMRLAPKLTEKHISLPAFSKMSVSRATQVLSATVAAGINTHVATGVLPAAAAYTANFCQNMDDLFDSMNSNQLFEKVKKMKQAVTPESQQISFWRSKIQWFSRWHVPDGERIKCIDGWVLTLSATISLWNDLRTNYDFKFLFTRRLNQDPIENLFSIVRYKGGCNDNPMCHQFRYALKAAMINFLSHPSESNCQKDDAQYLIQLLETTANTPRPPPCTQAPSSSTSTPSTSSTVHQPKSSKIHSTTTANPPSSLQTPSSAKSSPPTSRISSHPKSSIILSTTTSNPPSSLLTPSSAKSSLPTSRISSHPKSSIILSTTTSNPPSSLLTPSSAKSSLPTSRISSHPKPSIILSTTTSNPPSSLLTPSSAKSSLPTSRISSHPKPSIIHSTTTSNPPSSLLTPSSAKSSLPTSRISSHPKPSIILSTTTSNPPSSLLTPSSAKSSPPTSRISTHPKSSIILSTTTSNPPSSVQTPSSGKSSPPTSTANQASTSNSPSSHTPSRNPLVQNLADSQPPDTFNCPSLDSLPKENILVYVAGFLCHKTLKSHTNCSTCIRVMTRVSPTLDSPNLYFSYFRAMDAPGRDFGYLTIPSSQFINFITQCEKIFIYQFNHYYHVTGIVKRISDSIRSNRVTRGHITSLGLCPELLMKITNLFARMRVHYGVKFYNRDIRGVPRKDRKLMKVSHL